MRFLVQNTCFFNIKHLSLQRNYRKEMKKYTYLNFIAATAISLLTACSVNDGTVSISGVVNEGNGEKIALMHLAGNNPVLVDTLTLGQNGSFKFEPKVEKGGPDFFCLVMNGQTIPLITDTLQTPVVIKADKDKFSTSYVADDSLNNELRKAVALGSDMRRSILTLNKGVNDGTVPEREYSARLSNIVSTYKENVLHDYIYQDPASPISYYLLFETVSGLQIFDPLDAQDNRAFGAVANLWLYNYPNSPRTTYLEQSAREGIALRTRAKLESERADSLVQNAIDNASSFLDLNLPGTGDSEVALSSVAGKGKVTLLDFTAFYISDVAIPHNEVLSKVYKKYQDRGIEIYQVCLDADLNFWKVSAANLPWVVVRDPQLLFDDNGIVAYSGAAHTYNVTNIPTTFIMGRDGSVLTKVDDDSKLDGAVSKMF